MASRSDDERRPQLSDDRPDWTIEEKDEMASSENASERANRIAREGEGDQTRDEAIGTPPVMPGGAAIGGTSPTSGAAGQAPAAGAGAVALDQTLDQMEFGQDDVKTGWPVAAADDARIGVVEEVGPERVLVDRSDREGKVYVPYTGIRSLDGNTVHLAVSSDQVDHQDWQQVLPASARPSAPTTPATPPREDRPSGSVGSGTGTAPPVTTGRGVEEGPTSHVIRAADRDESDATPTRQPVESRRIGETQAEENPRPFPPPSPPTPPKEMGPMRDARNMMENVRDNVRDRVQGATHGQINPNEPKEAFADMFSFLENIPNSFYYLATVASVLTSLWLFLSGKRWESLFVGLWAPTIVSASMFYKLLRPSHEVRRM